MGLGISKHPVCTLVFGLDNSGKTTVVDWLASRSSRDDTTDADVVVPTVGFVARRLKIGKTPITVIDMSGQVGSYHLHLL